MIMNDACHLEAKTHNQNKGGMDLADPMHKHRHAQVNQEPFNDSGEAVQS